MSLISSLRSRKKHQHTPTVNASFSLKGFGSEDAFGSDSGNAPAAATAHSTRSRILACIHRLIGGNNYKKRKIVLVACLLLIFLHPFEWNHSYNHSPCVTTSTNSKRVEWMRYSPQQQGQPPQQEKNGSTEYHAQGRRRLLIAQYVTTTNDDASSSSSSSSSLIDMISKINQAYASKWQQDYVRLTTSNCYLPNYRQELLQLAYDEHDKKKNTYYDQVLTLDETSVIYNLDYDISRLLPQGNNNNNSGKDKDSSSSLIQVVTAGTGILQTWKRWWYWESKASTALWNVHLWTSPKDVERAATILDNTSLLFAIIQRLFQKKSKQQVLRLSNSEFGGASTGTIVRTLQPNQEDWTSIDKTMGEICGMEPSICDGGNSTIQSPTQPRKPTWDWRYYSTNSKNDKAGGESNTKPQQQKVLLAQYSAFGTYAKLLELTAPLNKAYALKYHYDYVALQGSTLHISPRDSWHSTPEERSRFNKIALLQMALARGYDRVLLLDADAMVYDFSNDVVTTYLPNDHLLAAHRVQESDGRHAWNINNGVTIWNLHHPKAVEVIDKWEARCRQFLNYNPTTRSYMLRGDQSFLHGVLKRDNLKNVVWSYTTEFQYRNATVIKHFIREGLDWNKDDVWKQTSLSTRALNIEKAQREVCDKYQIACQDLEKTVYTD